MNSLSFFKLATLVLILLNLVLIFFLIQGRSNNPKHAFEQKAIDILQLDADQSDRFRGLAKMHNEAINKLNSETNSILKPYFKNLFSEKNNVKKDSLLARFQLSLIHI